MGGKSTYLRQNALLVVLAQAGSFVPAASAHLGIVDRLFSRVGAADDLARALFADAAASVAGAEHDDEALVLAVAAYEELLARAERPEQRAALETAITTLRAWKL